MARMSVEQKALTDPRFVTLGLRNAAFLTPIRLGLEPDLVRGNRPHMAGRQPSLAGRGAPGVRPPGRVKPLVTAADMHMGRTMAKSQSEASLDGFEGRQPGYSVTKLYVPDLIKPVVRTLPPSLPHGADRDAVREARSPGCRRPPGTSDR